MEEGKIQPVNLMHRHFGKSRSLALLGMTIKADPSTTRPALKNERKKKLAAPVGMTMLGVFPITVLETCRKP